MREGKAAGGERHLSCVAQVGSSGTDCTSTVLNYLGLSTMRIHQDT